MWADGAYAGFLEKYALIKYGIDLEIVRRSDERAAKMWVAPGDSPTPRENGFKLLPHRWIVERTLGWIGRNRRLSKDYEQRTDVSETWIRISMSRLMLRRLNMTPTTQPAPGKDSLPVFAS
jgi:transposase